MYEDVIQGVYSSKKCMENVGYYAANDFKGWYLPPFTFSTLKASAKKYDNVRNPLN
ncbi:hypothetical protein KQX54_008891, partial [Cotesia glomerata]